MKDILVVHVDKIHQTIVEFIKEHNIIISTLEDMKEDVIVKMIRAGYMFTGDRDRLRDAMEDITFMCSPDDDVNKDRVLRSLEYDDSDDDCDDYPMDPSHSHIEEIR